jgi:hypothetical protein
MTKSIVLAVTVFGLMLAMPATLKAAEPSRFVVASATEVPMTPVPGKNRIQSRDHRQQSQLVGNICRDGAFYCITGGIGYVGNACCGCGFCGWWSTF